MPTPFFRFLLIAALAAISFLSTNDVKAQNAPPKVGCMDKSIRLQADEIKQHYTAQGMEVFRDAMIGMQSQVPYPVMINLVAGQPYQIIYVAHPEATRLWLDVFDGNDKKMREIMHAVGREQPTYITFTFVPDVSDMYMFVARQKWKDKDMCGSFTILKPKADMKGPLQLKPYIAP